MRQQIVGRGEQNLGLIRMRVLLRVWNAAHQDLEVLRSSRLISHTIYIHILAGDQSWPFFITFLYLVTEILCFVIL